MTMYPFLSVLLFIQLRNIHASSTVAFSVSMEAAVFPVGEGEYLYLVENSVVIHKGLMHTVFFM